MEAELGKATHWNGQVGGPFHRCDMMLSKYTDQVNLLSDRWRRIQGQIDTRYAVLSFISILYQWPIFEPCLSSITSKCHISQVNENNHLLQPERQHNLFTPVCVRSELSVKGNSLNSLKTWCYILNFFFSLSRVLDLQAYQPQLEHYKQTSTSLIDWIDTTQKKQDALQATKIESIQALTDHINNQKVSCSARCCYWLTWLLCFVSMAMCFKSPYIFIFLCSEGSELRNQSKKGDSGECAEGKWSLREFYQGEEACISSTDFTLNSQNNSFYDRICFTGLWNRLGFLHFWFRDFAQHPHQKDNAKVAVDGS